MHEFFKEENRFKLMYTTFQSAYAHEYRLLESREADVSQITKDAVPSLLYGYLIRYLDECSITYGIMMQIEQTDTLIEDYHFETWLGVTDDKNTDLNDPAALIDAGNGWQAIMSQLKAAEDNANMESMRTREVISKLFFRLFTDNCQMCEFFGDEKSAAKAFNLWKSGDFMDDIDDIISEQLSEPAETDPVQQLIEALLDFNDPEDPSFTDHNDDTPLPFN